MIEIKGLSKGFPNKDLFHDLNCRFPSVGLVNIYGPSGSGKSTLAQIIMGLEKADRGAVIVNGYSFADHSNDENADFASETFGYAGENRTLFPEKNLSDNLKILAGDYQEKECRNLSSLLKFLDFNKPINKLSCGNLKKAKLLLAFLGNKSILVLDEPFAFLDTEAQTGLRQILSEYGKTRLIIIISHEKIISGLPITASLSFPDTVFKCDSWPNSVERSSEQLPKNNSRFFKKEFTKSFIKENRFVEAIHLFLALLFSFSLSYVVSAFGPSELRNPVRYSLEQDPNSEFGLTCSDSVSAEGFQEKRNQVDYEIYRSGDLLFFAVNGSFLKNNTLYSDSLDSDSANAYLLTKDGKTEFNIDGGFPDLSFPLAITRNEGLYSAKIAVSYSTMDEILDAGGFSSLYIDGFQLRNIDASLSASSNIKSVTVYPSDRYYLAVPGVAEGTKVFFSAADKEIALTTVSTTAGNSILVSPSLYRYLSSNIGDTAFYYYLCANKASAWNLYQSSYLIQDLIVPNFEDYTQPLAIVFLIMAILFILLDFLFYFITEKKQKENGRQLVFFARVNGLKENSFSGMIEKTFAVISLVSGALGLIIYFVVFIPLENHLLFTLEAHSDYAWLMGSNIYQGLPQRSFQAFSSMSLTVFAPIVLWVALILIKTHRKQKKS